MYCSTNIIAPTNISSNVDAMSDKFSSTLHKRKLTCMQDVTTPYYKLLSEDSVVQSIHKTKY